MKKLLLVIFIALSISAYSQETKGNKERLKEIETELQLAVDAGNFDKAARLKKERELREKIQKEVEAGNFDEAARLKKQLLDFLANGSNAPQEINNSVQSDDVYMLSEEEVRNMSEENPSNQTSPYTKLLKSGIYFEVGTGYANQLTEMDELHQKSITFKLNGGWKWFFGNKGKKSRFGLDINFANVMGPITNRHAAVEANFLRPGIVYSFALGTKMAMDLSANIGYGFARKTRGNTSYEFMFEGIAFTQSTRIRLFKWAFAGFDISVGKYKGDGELQVGSGFNTEYVNFSDTMNITSIHYVMGFKF